MPSDPFLRGLTLVGLGVAACYILACLAAAVIAPFWAYRYVTAPERHAPHPKWRWVWETMKVELVASGMVGGTAALVALFLSRDTALRDSIGIANLALSLVLAVIAPIVVYQNSVYTRTHTVGATDRWLVKVAECELWPLCLATLAALLIWPIARWLYFVLFVLYLVSGRRYILGFVAEAKYAFVGSFRDEYQRYLARHGRNSEMELRMQMRMHGGQLDVDATEGEGGNAIP